MEEIFEVRKMNIRQMKKFINKYGIITREYVRSKGTDPDFPI